MSHGYFDLSLLDLKLCLHETRIDGLHPRNEKLCVLEHIVAQGKSLLIANLNNSKIRQDEILCFDCLSFSVGFWERIAIVVVRFVSEVVAVAMSQASVPSLTAVHLVVRFGRLEVDCIIADLVESFMLNVWWLVHAHILRVRGAAIFDNAEVSVAAVLEVHIVHSFDKIYNFRIDNCKGNSFLVIEELSEPLSKGGELVLRLQVAEDVLRVQAILLGTCCGLEIRWRHVVAGFDIRKDMLFWKLYQRNVLWMTLVKVELFLGWGALSKLLWGILGAVGWGRVHRRFVGANVAWIVAIGYSVADRVAQGPPVCTAWVLSVVARSLIHVCSLLSQRVVLRGVQELLVVCGGMVRRVARVAKVTAVSGLGPIILQHTRWVFATTSVAAASQLPNILLSFSLILSSELIFLHFITSTIPRHFSITHKHILPHIPEFKIFILRNDHWLKILVTALSWQELVGMQRIISCHIEIRCQIVLATSLFGFLVFGFVLQSLVWSLV